MRIAYAVLALGFLAAMAGSSQAADLYREGGRVKGASGAASPEVRMRVVEQVPYCGDCDNLIGTPHSSTVRLSYFGYPIWERGCARGGCYGLYCAADSCYYRKGLVRNAQGRWVQGFRQYCD